MTLSPMGLLMKLDLVCTLVLIGTLGFSYVCLICLLEKGVQQDSFLVKLLSWLKYLSCVFCCLGLLILRLQVRSYGSVSLFSFLLYSNFLKQ